MRTSATLLLLLVGALGCERQLEPVRGPGYQGVILSDACNGRLRGCIPSTAEIAAFERELPRVIESTPLLVNTRLQQHLPAFRRRYSGYRRGSSGVLCVMFIDESTAIVASGKWRSDRDFSVAGGGNQIFEIRYDTGAKRVVDLTLHAEE